MTIQEINDLIANNNLDRLKEVFELNYDLESVLTALKQFNPKTHDVTDPAIRLDKNLYKESGTIKANGEPEMVLSGIVKVTRLSRPLQQKIVTIAAAMLGNPEIECAPNDTTEEAALEIQQKIWDDNKLDYKFMRMMELAMSEKSCAELWFTVPADADYWDGYDIRFVEKPAKLKMKILAHSLGDSLYPVFDSFGDMVAFARGYKNIEDGEEVDHLDIYTADKFYFNKKVDNQWVGNYSADYVPQFDVDTQTQFIPNHIGKIPVIYYHQPVTEWHYVQEMIDRIEKKISNHADTNDRFDSPIMFTEGEIGGFSDKDDTGKLLQGDPGSKVSYLTWDNAPESMKMEIENLLRFIHSDTHTPDISFENLKNLGYFSTIALKTMFMDAHLKAAKHEANYGEMVQRRINYIKAAIAIFDSRYKPTLKLKMRPKFTYFMPNDDVEKINMLATAVTAGIMSKQTGVELNPLISDGENEMVRIGEETQGASGLDNVMNA